MNKIKNTLLIAASLLLCAIQSIAQVPQIPAGNLGLTNMQDGNPPPFGGFTFIEYIQEYQTVSNRGPKGENLGGIKVNSLLSNNQLVYLSPIKVGHGHLGITLVMPVVRLSLANVAGPAPSVNPNPLGDLIIGPFIQWHNQHLFTRRYSHRLELDLIVPTGSYASWYMINPGTHLYTISPHYTFTIFPTEKFSISMRHHLNYYFEQIGTGARPGFTYNFNYSLEYAILPTFRVEVAGYYLRQLLQDSHYGDFHYYQETFGVSDTREKIFAFGLGLSYVTPIGVFIELKEMREVESRNYSEGYRTTMVFSIKLDKIRPIK
jgi:hypothetical protein